MASARCGPAPEWRPGGLGYGSAVNNNLASYADLATAAGTLVLAVATFRAVRSANRAARVAEQALLLGLRPLLVPSRLDDPAQKIFYGDGKFEYVQGGRGAAEVDGGNVYLAISLRNAGRGIAVLRGWRFMVGQQPREGHAPLSEFHEHQRDIFVAPNDIGFWQAAFREPDRDPQYGEAIAAVRTGEPLTIDVLYGDHEGGQRAISRFMLRPFGSEDERVWLTNVVRHWNIDRPDPR
jgi:hypothetical protein